MLIGINALLLMASHASAHHNWSALYDVESDIEIEGVISSIQWRNPHVRVSFTVNEGTAEEMVYTTESNSVASLDPNECDRRRARRRHPGASRGLPVAQPR